MFGTVEISKVRQKLTRFLLMGEVGRWLQLERADKTPLLTFEIINSENLSEIATTRDWELDRLFHSPDAASFLVISDSGDGRLLALIDRSQDLPTPLFPAVEKYYDEARRLNTVSYRSLFPSWDTHIVWVFILFCIFTYISLLFQK